MNVFSKFVTDTFGNAFDFLLPGANSAAARTGIAEWEAARIVMLAAKKRWLATRSASDKLIYLDAIARMQAGANKAGKKIETARAIAQAPADLSAAVRDTINSAERALNIAAAVAAAGFVVVFFLPRK